MSAPIVYVKLESGLVVKHTWEEYQALIKGVDLEAAKILGEAVIAKGSHITSWKALELTPAQRICHDCGRKVRLWDVARLHWEHGKLSIRCVECMRRV